MLTNLLIEIIRMLLDIAAFAVPNWLIPDYLEQSFLSIIQNAMEFNAVFPIGAILIALNVILWFHILLWSIRAISAGLSLVRGGGSSPV